MFHDIILKFLFWSVKEDVVGYISVDPVILSWNVPFGFPLFVDA